MYRYQQSRGKETDGCVEVVPNVRKSVKRNRTISSVRLYWELKEREGLHVTGNSNVRGQQQQETQKPRLTVLDYGFISARSFVVLRSSETQSQVNKVANVRSFRFFELPT
jgi:hypothetical protein